MKHPAPWLVIVCITTALLACGKKSEHAPAAAAAPAMSSISNLNASGAVSTESKTMVLAAGSAKTDASPAVNEVAADNVTINVDANGDGTSATISQRLGSGALNATPKGRQLVRTAQLKFTVEDVYLANLAIEDALAAHDGFVVSSTINSHVAQQADYPAEAGKALRLESINTMGDVVLRLPSGKAQAFLRSIAAQMDTLAQRSIAANDVQFDLLRQQLEATRAQMTNAALTQLNQTAGRIADKNQTIAQARQAAIDANEAQLAKLTLADQVDYATITLQLSQPQFVRRSAVIDFEAIRAQHRPGFTTRAAQALAGGWAGLQSFVIGVLDAWPLVLVVIAIITLWRRASFTDSLKQRLNRHRATKAQ